MENYKKVKVLGKGAFGKVYLVLHKQVCVYYDKKKKNGIISIASSYLSKHPRKLIFQERVSYALKMIKVKGIPKKEMESTRLELKLLQQLAHPR